MKKKNIMKAKEKEINELASNFECCVFSTNEGCMINGDVRGVLACICGAIEMVCEDVPKELVRDCIEIAFYNDKEKDEMIKKQKDKSKKKENNLKDLQDVIDALKD